jgi:hypothetical protein
VGISAVSNQRLAASFQRKHLNNLLSPHRLQKQAYDHVLREEQRHKGAVEKTVYYILKNPVRADLVNDADAYPFSGCLIPGYPDWNVHNPQSFWPAFWKVYARMVGQV